ncbi:hypothetical protein diail_5559, partial [Diaporthe ilicicola]
MASSAERSLLGYDPAGHSTRILVLFRAYTDPLNSSGQSASNSLNPPSIPPPPPPPPPLNIPPSRARMAFAARLASKRKEAEEAGEDGEPSEEKGLSSLQGKEKEGEGQLRNPFADDEDEDEQSDDEDEEDEEGDLGRGENTSGQNSGWNRGGWWRGALGGRQDKGAKETFGDGRDSSDSEDEPEGQGGNSSDEEFGDFAMPESSGNTADAGGAASGIDADREKVLVKPMPVHPPGGGGNKGNFLGLWPFAKKDKDNSPTKEDSADKEKTGEAETSTEKPIEAQAAEEVAKEEEEKEAAGEKDDVKEEDKAQAPEPPVVLSEDGEKVQPAIEAKRRTSIEEPDEGDEAPLSSSSTIPSAPPPARKKRANSRLQAWHDGADKQHGAAAGAAAAAARGSRKSRGGPGVKKDPPPLIRKVGLAAQIYGIQGVMGTVLWFQGWREWLYPPDGGPDIVKAYECRPGMGVRIFFPKTFDLTSPQTLPTILSVHGGGFCVGTSRDDDEWNRRVADSQGVLVISLPYSKAPRAPFPAGLRDLEALYLAVLADESLPIDRTSPSSSSSSSTPGKGGRGGGRRGNRSRAKGRVALAGFDAGANLALALSQMPAVRGAAVPPTAVVSICGILDLARPVEAKLRGRPYKPGLSAPRNGATDMLAATHAAYAWSYVPYGQDLRDPWLSPAASAGWGGGWGEVVGQDGGDGDPLPPHVCLVGAELDIFAHESWRMACRLVQEGGIRRGDGRRARWRVPDPDDGSDKTHSICGREQVRAVKGSLEMEDLSVAARDDEDGLGARKRFGFQETWPAAGDEGGDGDGDEDGSVRWILVPDVMHGFDRALWRAGGEETARDAELKTVAYIDAVGRWLRDT